MNQLPPEKIHALITGGAGFIGSHLAEYLIAQGQVVHVVDDLSTGSIENIDSLRNHPEFSHTVADVREEPLMAELVDRADVIYHLAAAVGVRLIVENPVRTIETNIGCTEVILKLANKKRKKVVLASTSEVYGKNNEVPFKEDHDLVLGPTNKARWSYACSKAIDEFLALAYHRSRGLPVVVARMFNTVGPRQTGRYGMVLPSFVRQALTGQPITVFGDGKQSRCFSYVGEVVKCLAGLSSCLEAEGRVVNVGSRREISIGELAKLVKKMTDSTSEIVYVPYDQAYQQGFEDMARRLPDVSLLESLLGMSPQMDIADIVGIVIKYFREH